MNDGPFAEAIGRALEDARNSIISPKVTPQAADFRRAILATMKTVLTHVGAPRGDDAKVLKAYRELTRDSSAPLPERISELLKTNDGDQEAVADAREFTMRFIESCAEFIAVTPADPWDPAGWEPLRAHNSFSEADLSELACFESRVRSFSAGADAYLFGSRATTSFRPLSDWDIFLVLPDKDYDVRYFIVAAIRDCFTEKVDVECCSAGDFAKPDPLRPVLRWLIAHRSIRLFPMTRFA